MSDSLLRELDHREHDGNQTPYGNRHLSDRSGADWRRASSYLPLVGTGPARRHREHRRRHLVWPPPSKDLRVLVANGVDSTFLVRFDGS